MLDTLDCDRCCGCSCGCRAGLCKPMRGKSCEDRAAKHCCHNLSHCNWQKKLSIRLSLSWLRTRHFWIYVILFLLLPTGHFCMEKYPTKVCPDIHIRNTLDAFNQLTNCTVIEGSLRILLIERSKAEEFEQLHFPHLVEITDFFLIYRVYHLRTFKNIFPNLSVIRGVNLFFDYALVAFEVPGLEELGLPSLTHIARGAVRLEKNPNLCYIKTIDWNRITQTKAEDNFIVANKEEDECIDVCPQGNQCPLIPETRQPACWSYDKCQKVCNCPGRACKVGTTDVCCHEQCVGGCYGPSDTDCIACKNFNARGRCLQKCDPHTYEFHGWSCILSQECKRKTVPGNNNMGYLPNGGKKYRLIDNKCTPECPKDFTEATNDPHKCVPCDGDCPKICPEAQVDSVSSAQGFEGCTEIKGSLIIYIQGGGNTYSLPKHNVKQSSEGDMFVDL